MKKALIIGGAGFVGNYLTDYLEKECECSVAVTKMEQETISNPNIDSYNLDILKRNDIVNILKSVKPDYVFHLAAQSSVGLSWKNPELTIDVNIKGSVNLLEAVREAGQNPRILMIGSGEEYGRISKEDIPICEETILHPGNIYAATKACQNMFGKIYSDAYQMEIIMVRAFNHIGPFQSPTFVVADFCKQVAEIEKGKREAVIKVGNLNVHRDFTDVRDVVAAYALLIEKGKRGETYNVGSGKALSIQSVLEEILQLSSAKIKIEINQAKFRPVDVPIIEADIKKLVETTGWKRKYKLTDTLKETLNYWRQTV